MEYGGAGDDTLTNAVITEELLAADPGIGLSNPVGSRSVLTPSSGLAQRPRRRSTWSPLRRATSIMGAAISEPVTGSDVSSVSTQARKDGDEWVINGSKMWITNGSVGDYFVGS